MKKGRWQLERERHKIVREYPIHSVEDPTPVGKIIFPIVQAIIQSDNSILHEIGRNWETIAGKEAVLHCRPGRVEGTDLIIFVDSPVWLNEIVRYEKTKILRRLQTLFGRDKITRIMFKLDPEKHTVV